MHDIPNSHLAVSRPFPSLARFWTPQAPGNFYIVADPAALHLRDQLTKDGSVHRPALGYFPAVAVLLFLAGLPMAIDEDFPAFYWPAVWTVVSLIGAVGLHGQVLQMQAKRRMTHRILRISRDLPRAWELCVLVDRITDTRAWKTYMVDRERLIPGLLWRYVQTSISLLLLEEDLGKAETHANLAGLVQEKRRQAAETAAALDEIDQNLYRVLHFAESLDQRRRDQQAAAARMVEEAMLRQRLTGTSLPVMQVQDDAMFAYTLQAEAEALNELLQYSDRLISGLR